MKLSEFKDEKALQVISDLLVPIGRIAANPENAKAKDLGVLDFASAILRNSGKDVMTMLAILNDQDPATYHCTAASVMMDVFTMLDDPELLLLFGLQSQTPASSGSASESTEAPKA